MITRRVSSYSSGDGNCVEVEGNFRTSTRSGSNGDCVDVGNNFRTSRHSMSNGNCIDVGNDFTHSENTNCIEVGEGGYRKSSFSNSCSNCIEVADGILIRDTKQKHLGDARTVLRFSESAWREFTERLKTA